MVNRGITCVAAILVTFALTPPVKAQNADAGNPSEDALKVLHNGLYGRDLLAQQAMSNAVAQLVKQLNLRDCLSSAIRPERPLAEVDESATTCPRHFHVDLGTTRPHSLDSGLGTTRPHSLDSGLGTTRPHSLDSGLGTTRPHSLDSGLGITRPHSLDSGLGITRPHSLDSGLGITRPHSLDEYANKVKPLYVAGVASSAYFASNVADLTSMRRLALMVTGSEAIAENIAPTLLTIAKSAPWRGFVGLVAVGTGGYAVYQYVTSDNNVSSDRKGPVGTARALATLSSDGDDTKGR